MEYYLAFKKQENAGTCHNVDELWRHAKLTWQSRKDKPYIIPLTCGTGQSTPWGQKVECWFLGQEWRGGLGELLCDGTVSVGEDENILETDDVGDDAPQHKWT